MVSKEAISKTGVIGNENVQRKIQWNPFHFGISENDSTSLFQAIGEKEKTTNRAKEFKNYKN